MNTYVYVDGFNLYYGAVKGTPYKWLNINALCTVEQRQVFHAEMLSKKKFRGRGYVLLFNVSIWVHI